MPLAPQLTAWFSSEHGRAERLRLPGVLNKDEEGFNYLIEFVIAMFVFVVILTAYYAAVQNQFSVSDGSDDTRIMDAMRVLDTLTTTPGLAGNSTQWEELDVDQLDQQLLELGFAYPAAGGHYDVQAARVDDVNLTTQSSRNILNAAKIDALRKVSYQKMKELFSIEMENLELRIAPTSVVPLSDGQREYLTLNFGVNATGAEAKNTVERLFTVSFLDVTDPNFTIQSNHTVVSIKLTLLEGIVSFPRVVMTELNYAPFSENSNEEWVELYNTNDAAVNLSEWSLTVIGRNGQEKKDFKLYLGSMILPGKGRAVVAANPETLLEDYPVDGNASIYIISGGVFGIDTLPNDNGTLVLEGVSVPNDVLAYDFSMGGGDDNHRTLVRVSIYKNLLRESTVDRGSPGS